MDIYELILNTENFSKLKLIDINNIFYTCKVKNCIGMNQNVKRYFYKIVINNEMFSYDLDRHYNIIELLEIVKNDIETDLPF